MYQGKAVDIVMSERLLEVETISSDGKKANLYIPYALRPSSQFYRLIPARYDKLVIAVGSSSSTHGVPGLEHCFQLKTIADAQQIRRRVMGLFSPHQSHV
jgi:NADH dehydrogenase FAD-containing subunit